MGNFEIKITEEFTEVKVSHPAQIVEGLVYLAKAAIESFKEENRVEGSHYAMLAILDELDIDLDDLKRTKELAELEFLTNNTTIQ